MEEQIVDNLIIVAGIIVIVLSTGFAIRTFMVPSGAPPLINRLIFRINAGGIHRYFKPYPV